MGPFFYDFSCFFIFLEIPKVVVDTSSPDDWNSPCEHFMENDAKWPDIAFLWIVVIIIAFWRHISWGPNIVIESLILSLNFLTVAKIDEDRLHILSEQNIFCFEVSMDKAMIKHSAVSFHNNFKNL